MTTATTIHTKVLTTSEAAYYPLPSLFEHAYHCWCSFISDMEDIFRQLSGVDKDKRKYCRNQGSDKWQKAQVVETRKQDKGNMTNKLSNARIYITNANYLSPGAPSKVVVKDASGKPVKTESGQPATRKHLLKITTTEQHL